MSAAPVRGDPALDPRVTNHLAGELSVLAVATNYKSWLWERTEPHIGRRVLDVGAGLGLMTDCVADREHVVAMELVPEYVEELRRHFHGSHVQVVAADATDPAAFEPLRASRIDSAMSFNVLEHIADDVAVLRNVFDTLTPGGRFVCFIPAFPSIYGSMDAGVGHVRRYRRREFMAKARSVGFKVRVADYMNLPGYFAWFINGRILRSDGAAGGTAAVRVYDRTVVPVARWLERRARPPFGQSLFAVVERPAQI